MGIKEKEIDLLEGTLERIRTRKNRLDSTSGSLFLLSLFLYVTSEPNSIIKLALLGFELQALYAVYILYLASLLSATSYVIDYIREIFLFERYKALLIEAYGSIPKSLPLIFSTDYQLRDHIFTGKWNKINTVFHWIITLPFLIGYIWMSYELITINTDLKLIMLSSFFTLVFSINFFVLFCRGIYLNWKNEPIQNSE